MQKFLVFGIVMIALVAFIFSEETNAAPITRWVNNNAFTYNAPGNNCEDAGYVSIQAAVDAASSGDFIRVCPGTYNENISIFKDNLTLVSTSGAAVTTISAAVSFYVFQIRALNITVDGFTILPAGVDDGDFGINLAVEGNAKATIANNTITGGRIGINLGCASNGSTVAHNIVNGQSEAAINVDTCEGSETGSDGNTIRNNTACGGTFSYSIAVGDKSVNNKILNNVAIWITVSGTNNNVHHNIAEFFNIASGNTNHDNFIDLDACP